MRCSVQMKMKKIAAVMAAVLLALTAVISFDSAAYADTESTMVGVSAVAPEVTQRDSTSRPSKTWEINKSGRYPFAGWSYQQTLYTDWQFKGETHYTIQVHNSGSRTITVKAKSLFKTYAKTQVGAGRTVTFQFSGISSSAKFYLTFESNGYYSFSGSIV